MIVKLITTDGNELPTKEVDKKDPVVARLIGDAILQTENLDGIEIIENGQKVKEVRVIYKET